MPHLIDPSTLRILHPNGKTVGTGFLVAPNLAVTCAHVVVAANALDGDTLQVQFSGCEGKIAAFVEPELWRDVDNRDVAFLRLDSVPDGITPLHLGLAAHSQSGNPFYAFGYATAAEKQGIGARGTIITLLPDQSYLQIRAHEAHYGMSGGPVFDEQRGVVVGMVTQGHTGQGRNAETTFATPSERLFAICPELCPDETCPYRGLENFTAETAQFFFGREALTEKLVTTLRGGCRFLAVLGPSGSGKSSVVRAGLLPKLEKGLFADWRQVVMRPADDPFKQLKAAGLESLGNVSERIILFIDQFEELFTLCPDDQRAEFVAALTTALENSRFMLLLSMRDDFYSAFNAKAASLAQSEQLKIENVPGLLKADELVAMIERPAAAVGLALEEGLSELILRDLTRDGEARSSTLPLLEFALTQLWEQRCDGWLTHAAYQAIGGVTGSLARWADEAYSDLPKTERSLAESLLTSLVHPGDEPQGLPDTRRQRALEEFDPTTLKVIKHFADRRLLVTGGETVELVHDALLREWERLRGWLNEDRDNLRLREGVSAAANAWHENPSNADLLVHRGSWLEDVLKLRGLLNAQEQAYLEACKTAVQKRRLVTIASIALAMLTIILILVGWGWTSSQNARQLETQVQIADQQRIIALARQLAAQAQSLRVSKEYKQQLAVLLALRSMQLFPTLDAAQILQTNTLLQPDVLVFHSGQINSMAFSPDEKYLVTGDQDGLVHLALAATGADVMTFQHAGPVYGAAFSSDGSLILSASADHTARVWETATGRELARLEHGEAVFSAVFSKNGKYIATGSKDGIARAWDPYSGKEIARMIHEAAVVNVAISPNNDWVVSDSQDGTARVWKIETGEEIARRHHTSLVQAIAISPNGEYIASENCANYDMGLSCVQDEVIVWEALSGKVVASLAHNSWIKTIVFSPDNRYVASGGDEGVVKILDLKFNLEISRLQHDSTVTAIAFSEDGKYIVSGSGDGTGRLWEAASRRLLGQQAHYAWVPSVAISPTGWLMASGGSDGSLQITAYPDREAAVQIEQPGFTKSISFSPDSQAFFSVTDLGVTNVWDVKAKKAIANFHFNGLSKSVSVSADGRYLAGGGRDGVVHIYEVATNQEIAQLSVEGTVWDENSFSPDGQSMVSVNRDGKAMVWKVATGEKILDLSSEAAVFSAQFSPAGQYLVTENSNDTLTVFAADTGKTVARFQFNSFITAVAFSPDGQYLAAGDGENNLQVWELPSGKAISRMKPEGRIRVMAFSPNSIWIVAGAEDWTVRVWDVKSGVEISRVLHDGIVMAVAFSPDNSYVISGSQDGTARIWEAATGKEIGRVTQKEVITAVTFSPDGRYAAATHCDKRASTSTCDHSFSYYWVYRPTDLQNEACKYVNRNLTRAEWTAFIGDLLPYQAVCPNLPIEPEPTATPIP